MYTLAVDPGQAACGVALFLEDLLVACEWVRHPYGKRRDNSLDSMRAMAVTVARWAWLKGPDDKMHLICEWPQAYMGVKAQAPVADLLPMAGIDGALAALLPHATCEYVLPCEWKGQIPKPKNASDPYIVEVRIRGKSLGNGSYEGGRLSKAEDAIIPPLANSYRHNIIDAIGIGMHSVGRGFIKRRRVIAR